MTRPRPFVKWAGGKRALLSSLLPLLPSTIDTYYEPFVGGGAVFFALAAERRFARAVLSDVNAELINAYQMVRDHCEELIGHLQHAAEYAGDERYYLRIRQQSPASLSRLERAARVIYLNRACFNGLYRENRAGEFTVGFGGTTAAQVCNPRRLRASSSALQGVELLVDDFSRILRLPRRGDAVFLDPPYVPMQGSSFVGYHRGGFRRRDHQRVARAFARLDAAGVAVVASNSPAAAPLYRAFRALTVNAPRQISRRASGRGPVEELVIVGGSSPAALAASSPAIP